MREKVTGVDPPEPGNVERRPPLKGRRFRDPKAVGDYLVPGLSSTNNLGGLSLIRKRLDCPIRRDRWIPPSLRALDRAQSELQHPALALAISAAEWNWIDLTVWRSYPAKFARAETWKHIEIGLSWVQHLRRKGVVRP
jgi:hypothetical protein